MPNQYAVCVFNMPYMYPLWSQCGVKEVSVTQRKKYKCWLDNGHPAELNTSSVTHIEPLSIIRGSTSFEVVVFNELAIFFSSNEIMVFWNILLAEIWLVFRVFAPFIRKRQRHIEQVRIQGACGFIGIVCNGELNMTSFFRSYGT